jgi:HEAT repeat protein
MKVHRVACLAGLLVAATLCSRGYGYVDLAPTLAKIITDSRTVTLVKVDEFDRAKRTVTLSEIKTLKGSKLSGPVTHVVAASETAVIPESVLQWAAPGAQAVIFSSGRTAIVCLGEGWYQVKLAGSDWKLGADRPDLPLSYYGTVTRLATGIEKMVAGRDTVLTMMPHGVEQGASFSTALNRSALRGLVKVQRVRANMKMPGVVFSVSNSPVYMLGMGPVDEAELPEVVKQLQSADANERAEAADDIRQMADVIGASKVSFAVPALEKLLDDANARVRYLAAGAVLRITREHEASTKVLLKGLQSKDALERRDAAKAAAITGKAGAALVGDLAKLAGDPDERVMMAALQAAATLGPVALPARDAVALALQNDACQIVAADALGRMGPRAQPVPPALVKMLQSDQPEVVKAALRGMSQIGGKEALPAAEYIATHIERASEIDGYNMVIYLALLGPVAKDPAAKIRNVPIVNPVLPSATNWAMNAETMFPWENPQTAMYGDVGTFIYSAYLTELGERLKPCALKLAPKLIDGTAGAIPDWGYRMLNAAPEESVALLAPHLADANKTLRERAAVALGYMGPAAESAKKALDQALAAAKDEQEQRLLMWALSEIQED